MGRGGKVSASAHVRSAFAVSKGLRPNALVGVDTFRDQVTELLRRDTFLIECRKALGPFFVLDPIALIFEDRHPHFARTVRFEEVDVEVRYGAGVVPHVALASVEETAGVAEMLLRPFRCTSERYPLAHRQVG